MKTVTTTRVVLDKEERAIAKTWGSDWARIRADVKKYGRACILTGEWSGYNAGQRRICHSEYSRNDHSRTMALKTIVFTDGTTLRVEIRAYTIEQILEWKLRRIKGYDELIREARGAMVESFYIGQDNSPVQVDTREPEPAPAVTPEPVEEKVETKECLSGCGCEPNARGHEGPCKFPDQSTENKTMSRAEKIKEEQMGKNWYDR